MTVSEALQTRRSIRKFTDQPVDRELLESVLKRSQRAPSGGNTQPWHGIVLTGDPLQKLIGRIQQEFPKGRAAHAPEYHIYPPELDGAYEERRFGVGEDLYGALDISREEKGKRLMWFAENFRAFGAPVLMLVHTPKYMGPPQWSDIGMWLQSIMLLLREEGLDSCPQEAWAVYAPQIREVVDIPDDHIFFCGLAIGYRDADAPVNNFDVKRAPLEESVRWEGWE
ncbi:MAG: nitroreductase family protein [Sphingomonadales bacterium CG12_big_fil_rev_8_21_14_0_65_65_10]|jgi:nitroreductase|uniref:nitroreductase n=1 Tax=Blastomonas marina TaxID=1867408 RepID=UPI000CC4D036|nr:nitroreductase [Blastomonas marina]PIW56320.1 MAG: nitroreductase family protein [Sphingomonadales bacterium CG12_big_fil_rev_8_21_14_0_65_65_10]WPZ05167.1 nitroreductase [Blastomonas marina]